MRRAVLVPLVLLLVLVGGGAVAVAAYDHARRDVIAEGVRVAGVPVGGLHAADARARVERALAEPLGRPVVVEAGGRRFTLSAARLHPRVDPPAVGDRAVPAPRGRAPRGGRPGGVGGPGGARQPGGVDHPGDGPRPPRSPGPRRPPGAGAVLPPCPAPPRRPRRARTRPPGRRRRRPSGGER